MLPGGVHGFAPSLTSFVGGAGAVDEVASLLGEFRLVTVTGQGGVASDSNNPVKLTVTTL